MHIWQHPGAAAIGGAGFFKTFFMKQIVMMVVGCVMASASFAQQNPVQWATTCKKIDGKTYEVRLTATVQAGWHIYSQHTQAGGPLATVVTFSKNPVLNFEGEATEVGDLKKEHSELFGVDVKYFNNKVEFVQKVSAKGKAKTKLNGTVEFMVCNDKECLPPRKVPFEVEIK